MGLFLRNLLFAFPVLHALLIHLVQAIITNTPGNRSDLLVIIHDIFHAHEGNLPALNYSKNTSSHLFYITGRSSGWDRIE